MDYATAVGNNSTAGGTNSSAFGNFADAGGTSSSAFGDHASAGGDYSMASGYESSAGGVYSTAVGANSDASGASSTAVGRTATASGDFSTAAGYLSVANATNGSAYVPGPWLAVSTASHSAMTAAPRVPHRWLWAMAQAPRRPVRLRWDLVHHRPAKTPLPSAPPRSRIRRCRLQCQCSRRWRRVGRQFHGHRIGYYRRRTQFDCDRKPIIRRRLSQPGHGNERDRCWHQLDGIWCKRSSVWPDKPRIW